MTVWFRRLLARGLPVASLLAVVVAASPLQAQSTAPLRAADTLVGRTLEAPTNRHDVKQKFWWKDAWYEAGQLAVPQNFAVVSRSLSYTNAKDGTEVPALLFRPKGNETFPAVLFQHGRRGLDALVRKLALRLAARGFVVLAPDVYTARFIDPRPIEHLRETEQDVDAAIDVLLALPDVSTSKLCAYSHTRGGYYTLRVATTFERQGKQIACYVASYPHWQDPNAGEPMQVYRYAPEIDQLSIPALIFIGEYEQYQRRRSIEGAVLSMKQAGRDVRLIVYPGVGRGFDFRPPHVRTFADDLATKDATLRMAGFMRRHLKKWTK
mgnify:CR=1 FL=1